MLTLTEAKQALVNPGERHWMSQSVTYAFFYQMANKPFALVHSTDIGDALDKLADSGKLNGSRIDPDNTDRYVIAGNYCHAYDLSDVVVCELADSRFYPVGTF